jgi:hypothetical protein
VDQEESCLPILETLVFRSPRPLFFPPVCLGVPEAFDRREDFFMHYRPCDRVCLKRKNFMVRG